jgi:hypothetical protein
MGQAGWPIHKSIACNPRKGKQMMPMEYYANVKLPFYGWFGRTFATEAEARSYVARMLNRARKEGTSYRSRAYYIRQQLLNLDE